MASMGTDMSVAGGASVIGGEVVLGGYLFKKTRVGSWQRRYFETNGAYLTYYKSKKMEKLLAALSLPQVGKIEEVPDSDGEVGMFSLELNSRVYILRGKNSDEAKLWVQTLIRLRDQGINSRDSSLSQSSIRMTHSSMHKPSNLQGFNINQSKSVDSESSNKADWEKVNRNKFVCC